jgi:hypothetical protein
MSPKGGVEDAVEDEEIDIAALAEQLDEVGAKTDIERCTVMAHFAVKAGRRGIDSALADSLYTELALPKAGVWRSTFQNAKRSGMVKSVGKGAWAPTHAGENFATHGIRPGKKKRGK